MTSPLRITEVRVTVPQPPTLASMARQEKDDFYSSKPPKADVLPYIAWARRLQHLMQTLFSILNVSIPLHPVTKNPIGSISGTSSAWNPSSMVDSSVPSSTFTQYIPNAGNIAGIISSHSALLPRQGDDVAVPDIPPVQKPQNQITHNFYFNPGNSQQNGIRESPLGEFGVFRQQMQRQESSQVIKMQQSQASAPSFSQQTHQLGSSNLNNNNNNTNMNINELLQFDSQDDDIPPPPIDAPPSMRININPNKNMNDGQSDKEVPPF
ncbi:MAG: hypothetical protein EZS28_042466 [Streblomastix strix]|uniref:Uncharacterized protein n=1 Tax=Streblomastix strix TaxID=222440 RepID=A0A5J4TUQ3_9EUKA|nr:MAG: hypothetical protein EZS28_042466 [Streblomastix strix]